MDKLQAERLHTVPSVLNTAEKLIVYKSQKICKFCLNQLDENINKLEFGLDSFLNDEICVINQELCYGCRRMFSNIIQDFFIEDKKEKAMKYIEEILNMFKILL